MTVHPPPHLLGSTVTWKWMGRNIHGTVEEIHLCPTERLIKGKLIKRNGSQEKPAYLVKSSAGNLALKLHSELVMGHPLERPAHWPRY